MADSRSVDAKGYNGFGVKMCDCKPYGRPHPYEPGEWCSPNWVQPQPTDPNSTEPMASGAAGENSQVPKSAGPENPS
jgi:hypothetical protein